MFHLRHTLPLALAITSSLAGQEKPSDLFAPIPGPKVISTKTTVEEQQKSKKRPLYHQPLEVKKVEGAGSMTPVFPDQGSIVLLGNSLAERMTYYNHLEVALQSHFRGKNLTIRNLGFPGHTPAFRPKAGNKNPWAFPGAQKFRPEIRRHNGRGHYPSPDEWLTILQADTIIAFFGFNESFSGEAGLPLFKKELTAFVNHTLTRAYNHKQAPRLILATPTHVEAVGEMDAAERNALLAKYSQVIVEVAKENKLTSLDLFSASKDWKNVTVNGAHLNNLGYLKLTETIQKDLVGEETRPGNDALRLAVEEKNWFWRNDYRIVNGVHVYGQRWGPYGNINYPEEIEKVRQMTVLRDQMIWATAQDEKFTPDDTTTRPLTIITTNYRPSVKNGELKYLDEKAALEKLTLPKGYSVSTFATEKEFPNLANPMQMRFDTKGRLWISTMPSYPHYRPGNPKPDDKILIYEDTDGDGRADKETVWADGLSIPIGFDFAPDGGIFLTEGSRLTLLKDTDGDDRFDHREYLLDGFDPHDSHHSFSAFDTDHGGGLFMLEGRFLHSQVETPYGPERMTDGGVWRFDPHTWRVERVVQTDLSNPWGIAEDEYGQNILNDASGGKHYWIGGYGIKMPHSFEMPKVGLYNYEHKARPTSGSEFIYSRHFPDADQGDYIFGNTIGFRGIKQFKVEQDGPALQGKFKQDLISSSDGNFRPADLEIAPDGSLYFVDWHNALIGHMQHSARDPNRSSNFGRIYRITCDGRPLVTPPQIHGASITQLFENLKLPELNARKRSHLELRGRPANEVLPAAKKFATENKNTERLILEALWATWGQGSVDRELLVSCLGANDYRIRSAAVRVLRHSFRSLEKPQPLLLTAAKDPHARVRIEALTAASWMGGRPGAEILLVVAGESRGKWINNALNSAMHLMKNDVRAALNEGKHNIADLDQLLAGKLRGARTEKNHLTPSQRKLWKEDKKFRLAYQNGLTVFRKEGSCATCHQENGQGLKDIYPPLANSEWVTGDATRLAKLTLHGLWGPIEVNGVKFDGKVPMTAVGAMFNDEQIANVLTYVRNSWGNVGSAMTPAEIKAIREATKDRKTFYKPEELLKEHPFPTKK